MKLWRSSYKWADSSPDEIVMARVYYNTRSSVLGKYRIEILTSEGLLFDTVKVHYNLAERYSLEEHVRAIRKQIFIRMMAMLWHEEKKAKEAYKLAFGVHYNTLAEQYKPGDMSPSNLALLLPGMDSYTFCPACAEKDGDTSELQLYTLIQHVNDYHDWSRAQIADWLDKLNDDGIIDMSFDQKDPVGKETP